MGICSYIREETQVIRDRDPALKSDLEALLYPSFRAILLHRIAHRLFSRRHYFLARWLSQYGTRKTGIEIHPGRQLARGCSSTTVAA